MPAAFAEVLLGPAGIRVSARSLLIKQVEYHHDTASFVAPLDSFAAQKTGTPIRIQWGDRVATQTFIGYIHHVEPYYDGADRLIKVVCIGATFILRGGVSSSWYRQSYDTVARAIVTGYYLSADVEPASLFEETVVASGQGAWDFLVELATKVGYTLAGNGTEVRFLSKALAFRRGMEAAPLYEQGVNMSIFRPMAGPVPEGGDRFNRVTHGLDPRTGDTFAVGDDGSSVYAIAPSASRINFARTTMLLADSPGSAATQLAGLTQQNRFDSQARLEGRGDARLVQASAIYIQGVAPDYEGYWYVQDVEHEIRGSEYNVYLTLGRDAFGAYRYLGVPGTIPAQLRATPQGDIQSTPPPSVFVAGIWRSGWARRAS